MKKSEFVDAVAIEAGISKRDVNVALNAILNTITKALKDGKTVNFIGFGSFSTVKRVGRDARVPLSEKTVRIPERNVVRFRVGKSLKEAVL